MKQHEIVHPQGKLGTDLPDSEEALFELEHYPLFDRELGVDILGSEDLVLHVLESFDTELKPDIESLVEYHAKGNWDEIEKIAHKLKGGAAFGTVRLYFALLFLERYLKAGLIHCQEALYVQLLEVLEKTLKELKNKGIIP